MDFIFGCPVFRGSPIPLPTEPGAAGLHLRLSRFPTVTHPTADRARCCLTPLQVVTHPSAVLARFSWTTSSAVPFSGGHPSHCRPSPVLLDAFLRLSPLQVVTHPSADLARCCWTSSSVVPFPAVTHPTADRARCCLTFFFDCLLFRWSPILVPTWPGSPGLHLRLSRFPAVTHPTADMARHLWTTSSAVPFFGGHPSHCRPSPVLLDAFSSIVSSSGGHPSKCRPSPVLLDYIFGYPVSRRSPIPLPTEHGAA